MALSWVNVTGAAAGRAIFVNGNFVDAAGTVGNPFRVETGLNTFMLLKPDKSVEISIDAVIALHNDRNDPQLVAMGGASAPPVPGPASQGPLS